MDVPSSILFLSGVYFLLLGLWWSIQISKKYHFCHNHRIEFRSTISQTCGRICTMVPVEIIVRLIGCTLITVFCIVLWLKDENEKIYEVLSHATIFVFFFLCCIVECMNHCNQPCFFEEMDYVLLILSYGIQAIQYGAHVPDANAQVWITHILMQISALVCGFVTFLELARPNLVAGAAMRGLCNMILGTWLLHSGFVYSEGLVYSESEEGAEVIKLSMYYTWYVGLNVIVCCCIWLFTRKTMRSSTCCCLPHEMEISGDDVYLRNRVRFDYHVMDPMTFELD